MSEHPGYQHSASMGDTVEVRIDANPVYLCVTRSVARKIGEVAQMPADDIEAITLALEEAMTNVIRHGYGGPCRRPIIVRFTRRSGATGDGELEIVVRDYGRQVDPESIKSRDLNEVRPGGLGVHLIQSMMDQVEYSCPADGGMQLRMVKRITPSESKEG